MALEQEAPAFTKEQLLESAQFGSLQKDILRALLSDTMSYTIGQVHRMIDEFQEKVVD
ncbi:hypothetical protein [Gorillibacterium sp. sgz5001074]|uniref:hypothetical protein n=1 Tax=Gorillibacterium sp. sgz5001074 TaxID=3446695 RepID=UPI003F66122F